jgi:hypothetical protein
VYRLLKNHYLQQLDLYSALYSPHDVELVHKTISQMRIFFIVISQFQVLNIVEGIVKDINGTTLHRYRENAGTLNTIKRAIYSISEIVMMIGIFLSMNTSIKTMEEERER